MAEHAAGGDPGYGVPSASSTASFSLPVGTENLIQVDAVMESPKFVE
jgi:hypothetical protein